MMSESTFFKGFTTVKYVIFLVLVFFSSTSCASVQGDKDISDRIYRHFRSLAIPLSTASDLDLLISSASQCKLVLLGESSHGTKEFYSWRSEISKRLIREHNFSFIAVEGDWASIYRLNKYVKNLPGSASSADEVLKSFSRWPEWMWGNSEIEELAEWMRDYNLNRKEGDKVGFYGMDVYGQWEAVEDLLKYLRINLPDRLADIEELLSCFLQFETDEWLYTRAVAQLAFTCENEMGEILNTIVKYRDSLSAKSEKEYFRAKQNAYVLKNSEDYFRLAAFGGVSSWNSRATHMWNTVERLIRYHGQDSKAIVWAHNTHVGDARATGMADHGMHNIGMLSRQAFGEKNVFITGFGTYHGEVNAGSRWGSPMSVMQIPEAEKSSLEESFKRMKHNNFLLVFSDADRQNKSLQEMIKHRAIGVVYNPDDERNNYVPTILTQRYDAFIYIRRTNALSPIK